MSARRPTERRMREVGRAAARALVEHAGQGHGRPLIVSVSGGSDSSAMLLLLHDTQSRHGWSLRAAHVDHKIQSEAVRRSFRTAVETLAGRLSTPLEIADIDAPAEAARSGDGLEAAARRLRYLALADIARERGAPVIATAHTRDDQAETVLLNILRGSGLDGLSGMPPIRALDDDVKLVRPLLELSRADTEAVCLAHGWQPAHDPSNDDEAHTRNRIRRSLLPLMREINPAASDRLADLAQAVAADRELLELVGSQALSQLRQADGPGDPRVDSSCSCPANCRAASCEPSAASMDSSSRPSARRPRYR